MEENRTENNTLIEYLYRDNSNYKLYNSAVVTGAITKEQIETIMNCVHDGEYFVPSVVGLPEERFSDITEDDTCFFEIHASWFSHTSRKQNTGLSVDELVELFKDAKAKNKWEESLMNFPCIF